MLKYLDFTLLNISAMLLVTVLPIHFNCLFYVKFILRNVLSQEDINVYLNPNIKYYTIALNYIVKILGCLLNALSFILILQGYLQ